jgi:hypothetical protein
MGEVIIRASQEDDSPYLIWSTNVDNAIYVFENRAEIVTYLLALPGRQPTAGPTSPLVRLKRADETGSSTLLPSMYKWDDPEFLVMEGPRMVHGSHWVLPRTKLRAYAEQLLADNEAAAYALLELREDD